MAPRPPRFVDGRTEVGELRARSETLAGRAVYLTLRPLIRRERLGQKTCGR